MLLQLYAKNQKRPEPGIFMKLEKPHYGLISVPFDLKTLIQEFSKKKKLLKSILRLHVAVTSCKKNRIHELIFHKT